MKARTDNMNGRHDNESPTKFTKGINPAENFLNQVKSKSSHLKKQVGNYIEVTDDYAEKHPWRIAITAASIGVLIGAMIKRKKSFSKASNKDE